MLQSFLIGKGRPRRAPYYMALLAMLLQLVFSFGHFHAQDFAASPSGHPSLVVVHAQGTSGGAGKLLAGDVDCPICSSIQQLGSTTLLDGATLPLPGLRRAVFVLAVEPLWLTPPPHLLFDTRGPPIT
jgi:hypothetical protein